MEDRIQDHKSSTTLPLLSFSMIAKTPFTSLNLLLCRHSSLIQQGASLCDHLRRCNDAGNSAAQRFPRKFLANRIECMDAYTEFMIPPDPFGGLCPCLKPQREGPAYEKQMQRIQMRIMNSILMAQYALIEVRVHESMTLTSQCSESSIKISAIQDRLEMRYSKIEQHALDSARLKLLSIAEEAEVFARTHLESESIELKAEANRRVGIAIAELSRNLPYKSLVMNQASLQEVMNTCAASMERKAKAMLREIDDMIESLRNTKLKESEHMKTLMDPSVQMLDLMNEHQNESELFVIEIERKLDEVSNKWRQIKSQSVCRPVVSFEDEIPVHTQKQSASPGEILADPKKALKQTGKSIEKIGKGIASVPLKGFELVADGVDGFANIATSGANRVAELAGKGVEGVAKVSSEIGKAVGPDKPKKPQKPRK